MNTISGESLVLLEFLVDELYLTDETNKNLAFVEGENNVVLQFLDNEPVLLTKEDLRPRCGDEPLLNGKSFFFPMSAEQGKSALEKFTINLKMIKKFKPGTLPDSLTIGLGELSLSDMFQELMRCARDNGDKAWVKMLKETVPLKDNIDRDIGSIKCIVRLSCLGKYIVRPCQIKMDDFYEENVDNNDRPEQNGETLTCKIDEVAPIVEENLSLEKEEEFFQIALANENLNEPMECGQGTCHAQTVLEKLSNQSNNWCQCIPLDDCFHRKNADKATSPRKVSAICSTQSLCRLPYVPALKSIQTQLKRLSHNESLKQYKLLNSESKSSFQCPVCNPVKIYNGKPTTRRQTLRFGRRSTPVEIKSKELQNSIEKVESKDKVILRLKSNKPLKGKTKPIELEFKTPKIPVVKKPRLECRDQQYECKDLPPNYLLNYYGRQKLQTLLLSQARHEKGIEEVYGKCPVGEFALAKRGKGGIKELMFSMYGVPDLIPNDIETVTSKPTEENVGFKGLLNRKLKNKKLSASKEKTAGSVYIDKLSNYPVYMACMSSCPIAKYV